MVLTDKQIDEFLATIKTPKLVRIKKPEPAKPVLVSDRKLSVEGQRERVANEVKELAVAEKNAPRLDPDDFRVKRERSDKLACTIAVSTKRLRRPNTTPSNIAG